MIKTIIFDNGGVIIEDYWLIFTTRLDSAYGHNIGSITDKIIKLDKKATVGIITQEEVHEFIRKNIDKSFYKDLFTGEYPLRKDVVEYIKTVGEKFEVALLTNSFSDFDDQNDIWKMESIFGENIFSSVKIGFRKPEPDIYLYVLNKLGKQPNEVIFIDDREKNTEGARSVGMNVIQFKSLKQLKIDLPRMIKEINGKK